jgi:hypothetical protein
MDPLLFGVKADVVAEVIGAIAILSIFVERALAPVFEWRIILDKIKNKGFKEPIALAASFLVVYLYKFDAMAVIFTQEKNSILGYVITAAVVAGGSKGSVKLFRDWMKIKSSAQQEYEDSKAKTIKPAKAA